MPNFCLFINGAIDFNQNQKETYFEPKYWGTSNKKLKRGVKFVFGTKIILGAITLDMVAVLFWWGHSAIAHLCPGYTKSGSGGIWNFACSPGRGSLDNHVYLRLFSVKQTCRFKTSGIHFWFWPLHNCLWTFHFVLDFHYSTFLVVLPMEYP